MRLSDKQFSVNEAYRNLAKVISQRSVPLRLDVSRDRQMVKFHILLFLYHSFFPSVQRMGGTETALVFGSHKTFRFQSHSDDFKAFKARIKDEKS